MSSTESAELKDSFLTAFLVLFRRQLRLTGFLQKKQKIPDAMVMERIKGRALKEGRADDASEEIINNRIVTYHNQTEPLIEYYSKAEKYHEVDGIGSIDEIRERIFTIMDRM